MHSTADHDALPQGAAATVALDTDIQQPNPPPLPPAPEDEKPPLVDGQGNDAADTKPETPLTKEHATIPSTHTTAAVPPTSTATADDAPITKILHFLANATPGELAGVAVGLAAVTYLALGRLGLVLIGAFGGVVGFISWEQRNPDVSKAVRGERGIDVIERLLRDSTNKSDEKADESSDDEDAAIRGLDDFRPETREALGGLIDAVTRDYVKWWYSPIIPHDHSFPLACRRTMTSYILSMSNHMSRKRPADAFLDLLTNSSSIVIVFMSELAAAFQDLPPDSKMNAADAVYNYLAANPECHLANLLNQRQQAAKFKMVAEDLLGFLDRSSYACDPLRVFFREILANSVLEKTLQTCSKAEWINGWIVYLLEAGEPNLNQAIDSGMQTGPDSTQNAYFDMDGNVGNVGIAKPARISSESERGRRKETGGHKKKLSKAEEEMEEAMGEMKRMNELIAEEVRRERDSTTTDVSQSLSRNSSDSENKQKRFSTSESSAGSGVGSAKPLPSATSTDGFSVKSDAAPTPLTPQSPTETSSPSSIPKQSEEAARFTSFDQIVPQGQGQVEEEEDDGPKRAALTLHNADITVHDDAGNDKGRIRAKPNWDYWVQVEVSVVGYSGWMIVRRYSDFETLHEILRRIATISGATAFTELHKDLPNWKSHTRESLRGELERYLRDACWYKSLAESEGMKRFLEKSQGHTHGDSKSFGWESVGKGMLDVLTTAPKGAMEGGKTLVGGVTGVFGNLTGLNKRTTNQSMDLTANSSRLSISTPPRRDSVKSPVRSTRDSMDSQRSSVISIQPGKMPPMERRPSYQSQGDSELDLKRGRSDFMETGSAPASARPSREHSRAPSLAQLRSPSSASLEFMKLPPPPDQITDDYGSPTNGGDLAGKMGDGTSAKHLRNGSQQVLTPPPSVTGKRGPKASRQYSQMSEGETRVAVELIFAVINEMYTLSSAWNIRRTLLTAAKSFLLRPGNPSLMTVQNLIQTSVIDGNTSDAGIAAHFRKLRENMLPTEQELAEWPAEPTADEKEQLRIKARKLLIQSGVPGALMGVMGQAATGEALGRVFDCLQIQEVARGLMFGLMLQMVRTVTH